MKAGERDMLDHIQLQTVIELKTDQRERFRRAQLVRSQVAEIRVLTAAAIAQSREFMARADALFALPCFRGVVVVTRPPISSIPTLS